MNLIHDKFSHDENIEKQWKSIYILGGIVTIIALTGILLDIFIGSVTGGNLSALPQTAIERFAQFHDSKFPGLYNLDLLNIIIQMILIPAYFALFAVHRNVNKASSPSKSQVSLFSSKLNEFRNEMTEMFFTVWSIHKSWQIRSFYRDSVIWTIFLYYPGLLPWSKNSTRVTRGKPLILSIYQGLKQRRLTEKNRIILWHLRHITTKRKYRTLTLNFIWSWH